MLYVQWAKYASVFLTLPHVDLTSRITIRRDIFIADRLSGTAHVELWN